ncbi:hypothetical protein [Nocardia sp. NPDC047038]|uniref:hypothetical protein n=1 Tax=Nocardia sp. NPDC047038 TaxID=3154338 RepID=UPI00340E99EA
MSPSGYLPTPGTGSCPFSNRGHHARKEWHCRFEVGEDHPDHPAFRDLRSISLGDVRFPFGFFIVDEDGQRYVRPATEAEREELLFKVLPDGPSESVLDSDRCYLHDTQLDPVGGQFIRAEHPQPVDGVQFAQGGGDRGTEVSSGDLVGDCAGGGNAAARCADFDPAGCGRCENAAHRRGRRTAGEQLLRAVARQPALQRSEFRIVGARVAQGNLVYSDICVICGPATVFGTPWPLSTVTTTTVDGPHCKGRSPVRARAMAAVISPVTGPAVITW